MTTAPDAQLNCAEVALTSVSGSGPNPPVLPPGEHCDSADVCSWIRASALFNMLADSIQNSGTDFGRYCARFEAGNLFTRGSRHRDLLPLPSFDADDCLCTTVATSTRTKACVLEPCAFQRQSPPEEAGLRFAPNHIRESSRSPVPCRACSAPLFSVGVPRGFVRGSCRSA